MKDILPEKWMKVMAITTTALGVVASIGTSLASMCLTRSQFNIALEADQWSYFDAKSIKQDLYQVKSKALEYKAITAKPQEKQRIDEGLAAYAKNIERYTKEKSDTEMKAIDIRKRNILFNKRAHQFSLSVVFSQIAIMLSGVAVLLKIRRLWGIGLGLGVVSLYFIVNGLLLFLK